jgi:hypothetical protein
MMGNGNDTSRVNYCKLWNGTSYVNWPCEQLGRSACTPTANDPKGGVSTCSSEKTSLDYYKTRYKAFRSGMRFFAAVSTQSGSTQCLGQNATQGARYMEVASSLNGKSYDICTTDISVILSDLASTLQSTRVSLKTQYLFVDEDADPASIQITRLVGGDSSNTATINRDTSHKNGWDYLGYQENVDVVYDPVNNIVVNKGSGYAIGLYGTGQLTGADRASIVFNAAGSKSTVSN